MRSTCRPVYLSLIGESSSSARKNYRRTQIECNLAVTHRINSNFIPLYYSGGGDPLTGICCSIDLLFWGRKSLFSYIDMADKPSNVTVKIVFTGDSE